MNAPYHNPSAGHDFGCPCCRLPDGCRYFVVLNGLYLALGPGWGSRSWTDRLDAAHAWRSEAKERAEATAKSYGPQARVVVLPLPEGGA